MKQKFDITLISFSNPNNDSRTYNILNALNSFNLSICYFGFANPNLKNVEFKLIELSKKNKLALNWIEFSNKIQKYDVTSKIYFAADLFSIIPASNLSKKHKAKLIYDSREIYSALGTISGQYLKQLLISKIEKHYIKNVDEIIVSGRLDAEYLKTYFNHNVSYSVIMNVPPFKEYIKDNLLRENFSIQSKNIIIYQGAILKGRGIETTISAFIEDIDFSFVIMGSGPKLDEFQKKFKHKNIIFTGAFDQADLLKYTKSADLGIALFEDISFSYKLALPNKLFEYAMSRIPIIASDLPAIREIFEEFEFGKLLKYPFTPEEINLAAKNIISDSKRYSESLKAISEKYNYDKEIIKVQSLIAKFLR